MPDYDDNLPLGFGNELIGHKLHIKSEISYEVFPEQTDRDSENGCKDWIGQTSSNAKQHLWS